RRDRRGALCLQHRVRAGGADGVHPDPGRSEPRWLAGGVAVSLIGSIARGGSTLLTLEDPLPAFSFFVSLDPTDAHLPPSQAALIPIMALGAFCEVKGLGGELEVMPYAEGGCNDFVHQLPVRHTWGRVTLRRGVIRDMALWVWYLGGLNGSLGARRDGCITVCDEAGDPAVIYVFKRALATKWHGP